MRDAGSNTRKEVKGTGILAVFTLGMHYPSETENLTDNPNGSSVSTVKKTIISVKELPLNAGLWLLHMHSL